jgi:acyl carrier protein
MAMNETIRQIVLDCCRQHNELSDRTIDIERADEAPLFGVDGVLDSIALVGLILSVEQGIEDHAGVMVTLADAKAASQETSPFRTIGRLIAYASARVDEEAGSDA